MPVVNPTTIFNANYGAQTITTNTETVIATISNATFRSPDWIAPVSGFAQFAVNATSTSVTLRVRATSIAGTVLQAVTGVWAGTAGTVSTDQLSIVTQAGQGVEQNNATFVLTIQSAGAGANWNVTAAVLSMIL